MGQTGPGPVVGVGVSGVSGEDDGPAGGECRASSQDPGQVPAHQVGYQVEQVRHEGPRHGRAVGGGHLGGIEVHVDAGRGEGAPPVTGQPPFGGPLDHPAGHGVPPDLPQARRLLTGEEPVLRAQPHR